MKRNSIILIIALLIANMSQAQISHGYHIDHNVVVDRTHCSSLSRLSLLVPCPVTNQYQTISNEVYTNGQLLSIPDTPNKYVRFLYQSSDLSNFGNFVEGDVSFDAILHPFYFDFSQIGAIYPYNTSSDEYLQNTGSSGVYVVPNHPTINSIANEIWASSNDIVDYARKCYEYVAQNYEYLNPNTGLHPLADILAEGGGDCGNLSSIFVSLLRNKSIPSRHVVTFRPDASMHVWAEFYLENYGWIPVDVTYKQSDPYGDYFGNYDGDGVVVSKGVYFTLEKTPGNTYQCALFQTYEWWYWYNDSSLCSSIDSFHLIFSEELQTTHTIQASAGDNGIITPSGTVTVSEGDDQSFEMIPDEGYMVQDVYVDGNSMGPITSYTFTNVTADHDIYVSFTPLLGIEESNVVYEMVYPNPTTGLVTIHCKGMTEIKVYNTLGELVKCLNVGKNETEQIDLSDLPNGLFILQTLNESQTEVIRVVKN